MIEILENNKQEIINKFINKISSCKQLANEYGVCNVSMWKFLKSNNIDLPRKKLSEEQELNLIKDYESGINSLKLKDKYKISQSVVCDYLRRNNVEIKEPSSYFKDEINSKFFKTLTEESLWTLGWFYSDGNVNKKSNQFNITVQIGDLEVLQKIKLIMGIKANGHMYDARKTGKNCYVFHACDKEIHSDLIRLGCVPNKSLIIEYPNFFTEDWQHWTFLRGIWEGDGHLKINEKGINSFTCSLCSGSYSFIKSIEKILKNKLDINTSIKIHNKHNIAYELNIYIASQIIKFLDLIYKNGNIPNNLYLKRKFDIYVKMKEMYNNPRTRKDSNKKRYKESYFINKEGIIYHVKGLRKFGKEMGKECTYFAQLNKVKEGHFWKKSGWGKPILEQIEKAKQNNSIIEKCY